MIHLIVLIMILGAVKLAISIPLGVSVYWWMRYRFSRDASLVFSFFVGYLSLYFSAFTYLWLRRDERRRYEVRGKQSYIDRVQRKKEVFITLLIIDIVFIFMSVFENEIETWLNNKEWKADTIAIGAIWKGEGGFRERIAGWLSFEDEKIGDEMSEEAYIEQQVTEYGHRMVDAINAQDFSIVSPYLLPGSSLHVKQRDFIAYLGRLGITEEVNDYVVTDVVPIDDQTYEVTTFESIYVYNSGKTELSEYSWIYTVQKNGQEWQLSEIREKK